MLFGYLIFRKRKGDCFKGRG